MKKVLLLILLPLVGCLVHAAETSTPAAAPAKAAPVKNFLIVLKLVPRLYDEKAWTEADNATVGKHFVRLQEAAARNQVLLAGRTEEPLDRTMGLIIFSAPDEAAAREFMDGDPCVAAGLMTATLHPYGVAVRGK